MSRYPTSSCTDGIRWKGAWDAGTNYYVGDAVFSGSVSYVCVANHTNQTPPNATYWDLMVSGGGGDVNGPVSTTAGSPAIFSDTSGDVLAEGTFGTGAGEFAEGNHSHAELVAMTGATDTVDGASGLVPQPVAGDDVKYLKGDGTWGTVLASFDLVDDTTPQLGGDLDTNGNNIGIDSTKGITDENGNSQLILTTTASAVNYATLANAATGGDVALGVAGTDTDVSLDLVPKGAGVIKLNGTAFGDAATKDTGTAAGTVAAGDHTHAAYGDVVGPASAVDSNLALFDGTTGKLIKDGGTVTAAGLALLDDADADTQRGTLGLGTAATVNTGTAEGDVALLGTGGKFAASLMPDSVVGGMAYQGTWDADTNNPTIPAAAAGNKGYYYKVSVAGATNVDGITDWKVGDWIVSNGTAWDKVDNTESVSSVASKTGAVTLVVADITDAGGAASLDVGTTAGTVAAGDHTHIYLADVVDDTTPQLGGDLDANGNNIAIDSTNGLIDENANEQLILTTTASAINYATLTNAATGNAVALGVTGTDTDVSMNLTTKGAGVVQVNGTALGSLYAAASHNHAASEMTSGTLDAARLPVMVGDSGAGGTQGAVPAPGTGEASYFLRGDGTWVSVAAGGGDIVGPASVTDSTPLLWDGTTGDLVKSGAFGTGAGEFAEGNHTHAYLANVVEDTTPQLGGDLDTNGNNIAIDTTKGLVDENGNEQLILTTTASAVNYATLTNAATAGDVKIGAIGTDTDVSLDLTTKGAGVVKVNGTSFGDAATKDTGTAAGTVAAGDHTHAAYGDVTGPGSVTASNPVIWGDTSGDLLAEGAFGTGAGQFAEGNHTHSASAVTSGTFDSARLPVMVGDSGAGGTQGAIPAPGVGDAANFLRGDGTWVDKSTLEGAQGPEGLNWLGEWNSGTSYVIDDAVSSGGASYICTSANTNQVPPNATYWDVLAGKGDPGASGAGSGDVNGPATSVNGNLVAWANATGDLLSDPGIPYTSLSRIDVSETRSANIDMADNQIQQAELLDWSQKSNAVASSSGSVSLNMSIGNVFTSTLTENITTTTISNAPTATHVTLTWIITQDAVSAYTVALPSGGVWSAGSPADLSGLGETYIVEMQTVDGGTSWICSASGIGGLSGLASGQILYGGTDGKAAQSDSASPFVWQSNKLGINTELPANLVDIRTRVVNLDDITSTATAFEGGAHTGDPLTDMRDGVLDVSVPYLSGDSLTSWGYTVPGGRKVSRFSFYSYDGTYRIPKDIYLTRYDGGAWSIVPFIGASGNAVLNEDGTATCSKATGWCHLDFVAVDDTKFKMHNTSYHENSVGGALHVTEIQLYAEEIVIEEFSSTASSYTGDAIASSVGEVSYLTNGVTAAGNTYFTSTIYPLYCGLVFPQARTITKLRFYCGHVYSRPDHFKIERYDGGLWTKVPITTWSENCIAYNVDEAQTSADGWVTVEFASEPLDSQFRIHIVDYTGDANSHISISEIELYGPIDDNSFGLQFSATGSGIGTPTPSAKFDIENTIDSLSLRVRRNGTGSSNAIASFEDSNGSVIELMCDGDIETNGAISAPSDQKLKENIVDATPKLDDILGVRVVNYNLITKPDDKDIGVIAQELETIFPSMVKTSPDTEKVILNDGTVVYRETGGETKSVKYSVFIPILIQALQEMHDKHTALEARVAELEGV